MPLIPGVRVGDLPKTNLLPDMTARLRVNKAEYRDPEALKAEGKIKGDSKLSAGINLDLVVITEGEFFGRHVFDGVDVEGDFAYRSREFLEAVEYPADEDIDTDKLVDAEFIATIRTQKESNDGQYPAKNRIGKFMKVE